MEAVIFDGKEYTKASVLAERFGYTQDYLGQLCRAKKVDARLVGRAWYINLESIEKHRSSRYKVEDRAVASASSKKPLNNYLSRIDVEPILRKKTVKVMLGEGGKFSEVAVKYESDDYSLIPKVHREAVDAYIPILPAESEKLHIKTEKTEKLEHTTFKAEALPEVYLKGSLRVESLAEAIEPEKEENLDSNSVKSLEQVDKTLIKRAPELKKAPLRLKISTKTNTNTVILNKDVHQLPTAVSKSVDFKHISSKNEIKPIEGTKKQVKFVPSNITQDKKLGIKQNVNTTTPVIPFATLKALTAVLVALVIGSTFLALRVEGELSQGVYSEKISFQTKNLTALLQFSIAKITR